MVHIVKLVKFSQGKNGVKHLAMSLAIAKAKATIIFYELPAILYRKQYVLGLTINPVYS